MMGYTDDLILDTVDLAPCAHDEGVVECKDSNNVDALLAELGEVLDVSGDVVY